MNAGTHIWLVTFRKNVAVQTEDLHFSLIKMRTPARSCQYVWEVSDQQAAFTEALTVTYDGTGDTVVLQGEKGDTTTTVSLCRSAYYTVIKFEWGTKSYRCDFRFLVQLGWVTVFLH